MNNFERDIAQCFNRFFAARFGSGRTKEAHLMSWQDLTAFYQTCPGITLEEFRQRITLKRVPEGYHLNELNPK